jgi:hypothetical protein
MKKILYGIIAIIIAIAMTSFTVFERTKKQASLSTVFFEYTAPGDSYSEADVVNPDNWIEVADLGTCNGINAKACRIEVDESVTEVTGILGWRKLLSWACIVVAAYTSYPECFYVLVACDVIRRINNSL